MEPESCPPLTSPQKYCQYKRCSSSMKKSSSATCLRAERDKIDAYEEENQLSSVPRNAQVDIRNECVELRASVTRQQQVIQNLISELEKERNASSSAANEAMSMILKLQRDKSELQMDARQFKTFAEEKLAHDQEEIVELEELLYKKEEAIQGLSCAVQTYKQRLMSYGLAQDEADDRERQLAFPQEIKPYLVCNANKPKAYSAGDHEIPDVEKYEFRETPWSAGDQLSDLEFRISQLEKSPRVIEPVCEYIDAKNVLEKVRVGESPRTQKFSTDCTTSPLVKEMLLDFATDSPKLGNSFKKRFSCIQESSDLRKVDNASEGGDDLIDRVCTIDSGYQRASINGLINPRASVGIGNDGYVESPNHYIRDLEIQKLYARLSALEADRETMSQAIISMGNEKAQMALLKEIAQKWCREMSPPRAMPVSKQPLVGKFSFTSILKWIVSIIVWGRKPHRCKYVFGLSANNVGLLLLLDRCPHAGQGDVYPAQTCKINAVVCIKNRYHRFGA